MSFDDPGWGGDGGFGQAGSHDGPGWGGGEPPHRRPAWLNLQTLAGAGAALLIVVAVVLAVTLHHPAKKKKVVPVAETSRVVATTSKRPVPTSTAPKPSPTVTGETIATYDKDADAVCAAHASAIAGAGSTPAAQYGALVDEFGDLEALVSPSQDTAKQEQWIQQLGDALTALTHNSESSYSTALANADTTAASLGMTTCNNGY